MTSIVDYKGPEDPNNHDCAKKDKLIMHVCVVFGSYKYFMDDVIYICASTQKTIVKNVPWLFL